MRRLAVLLAIVAVVGVGVSVAQRLSQDRRYHRLLAEGELALRSGQNHIAVEAFSGAMALRPASMVAFYRRGEAYRSQHQDDRAVRDLAEARRLAPNAPQPLVALGEIYERAGNHAAAAEWYGKAAVLLGDSDPRLLYSLGLAHYRAGAPAAAQDPLRRALGRDGSLAEAHYLLGLVSRDAGDPREAAASLEQAIRLAPSLLAAREELADLYRETGRTLDEVRQLEALLLLDPQPERTIALALAETRQTRYDHAVDRLTAMAATAPDDSRVQTALGRAYLARAEGQADRVSVPRALSALELALGGTARRSEGLALYGRALYLSGDVAGAERILLEATNTSPVDPEAFGFLADAAERLSHAATARDALLTVDAFEGNTATPAVRATRAARIGALSLSSGDPALAIRFLTQAADNGLRNAQTFGLLARAYWQMGDFDGARRALADVRTLQPPMPSQ